MIFLAPSAYLVSCRRASLTYLGLVNLSGISFMISRHIAGDTGFSQSLGRSGSEVIPIALSHIFLSNNQRLKDSVGAWIPEMNTQPI